jgi:alpha-amylase
MTSLDSPRIHPITHWIRTPSPSPCFRTEFRLVGVTSSYVLKANNPVYSGQEQHYSGGAVPNDREAIWLSGYPTDSELYTWIASINQIRNQAIYKDSGYLLYKAYPVYSDDSTIVMRKGDTDYQIISVFTNLGAGGSSYTLTLPSSDTGFSDSQSVVEIGSCTVTSTDSSGNLDVPMASGLPRIYYPQAQLTGSGVCGQ